jgi:16S rRNA (cytidine1402-2'-O)-methyltransferase
MFAANINVQDVTSSRIITHCKCRLYAGINQLTAGTLYIVATPIGNLEDLSPRARQILSDVDLIAAEDTRHTGKLLSHFAISTRQIALHDHNEGDVVPRIVDDLNSGRSIALVSDAGTPLISDPGFRLVRDAHAAGIVVSPIPGPSAAIAAMSAAGLPSDRFAFEGFLPAKREARRVTLKSLRAESRTLIFFESVHRIAKTLQDMADVLGAERNAYLGRELSKLHEQGVVAPLRDLHAKLDSGEVVSKGEFVIVVAGAETSPVETSSVDAGELLEELTKILPGSQAVDLVSSLSGAKRNDVYKEMLALKQDQ